MCIQREKFDLARAVQDSDINTEFQFDFDEEEWYESSEDESFPEWWGEWHQHQHAFANNDEVILMSHFDSVPVSSSSFNSFIGLYKQKSKC